MTIVSDIDSKPQSLRHRHGPNIRTRTTQDALHTETERETDTSPNACIRGLPFCSIRHCFPGGEGYGAWYWLAFRPLYYIVLAGCMAWCHTGCRSGLWVAYWLDDRVTLTETLLLLRIPQLYGKWKWVERSSGGKCICLINIDVWWGSRTNMGNGMGIHTAVYSMDIHMHWQ